jgi:hypothetical protein
MSNEVDIWPFIEEDLKYAVDSLPKIQNQIGRANHYSAEALLAKSIYSSTNMIQLKFFWMKSLPVKNIVLKSIRKILMHQPKTTKNLFLRHRVQ